MYQAAYDISRTLFATKLLEGNVKLSLETLKTAQDLEKWHEKKVDFLFVK